MVGSTRSVTIDGRTWIPGENLGHESRQKIYRDLRISQTVENSFGFGDPVEVDLLKIKDEMFGVPREYGKQFIGNGNAVKDLRSNGEDRDFKFHGMLKDKQGSLVQTMLDELRHRSEGGILQSPCGSGKTVMALKIIQELGGTVLIVVHKEFLMTQWAEQIQKFLKIKPGFIQQNVCEFENKSIVIGMVHSLVMRTYPIRLYRWPRTVLYDEVHRMAAPMFQKVIGRFPSKYRIGLSATPKRKDGLDNVFLWNIGQVVAKSEERKVIPKVFMIRVPMDINMAGTIGWNGKLLLARVINRIAENPLRNEWVVKQLIKAVAAGRKVLVLSDRLAQLRWIHDRFLIKYEGEGVKVGFYIGGMHADKRKESEGCNLLLGTFQMAKEGMDIPELDTLLLATPKTDVEQAAGRILREVSGKRKPMVVDLVDSMQVMRAFAGKRFKQYKKLRYDVEWR